MSRVIDLVGHRSGRLTVVARAESRRTPSGQLKTYWECVCDCGSTSEVLSQNLRRRAVLSCGCLNLEQLQARVPDLAGRRFGRLMVVARAGSTLWRNSTWLCRCDCGNEKVIPAQQLTGGNRYLSCGCLRDLLSAFRRWQGDEVGYFAMHDRLRSSRGPASDYPCVDCGGASRDWSYDGGDPNEKREDVRGSLLAFSPDPDRYSPRCKRCHRRHDVAASKEKVA